MSALNDPIQKCLTRAYLKAMREKQQPKGENNGN